MKHALLLLLAVSFSSVLVQAQNKKSKSAPAPVKKQEAAPVPSKDSKAAPAFPSSSSLANEIGGESVKKLPPYRPVMLADSLAKFSPDLEPGTDALKHPYIIVAPAAADVENAGLFAKMAEELSQAKGVRNILVKNAKDEILAVAVNNPNFVQLFNERKKYISIKTYTFPSLKALENCNEPWIQYLNQEKALAKEISLQNVDYLPKTSEIKGGNDQLAP